MSQSSKTTATQALYAIFFSLIRLVILAYAALTVFCFFDIRSQLRNNNDEGTSGFDIKDGTLYVPLIYCPPSNLEVDGIHFIDSNSTQTGSVADQGCRQQDYTISACAASLLFATAGCVLFVFCDILARLRCCPFDFSSSSGMAIFLAIILAQTGISIGAFAEQNYYWIDFFEEIVDELGLDLRVKSYGKAVFLISCSLSSFVVALLLLVDATCSSCCKSHESNRMKQEEEKKTETGIMGWIHQARDIEDAAQTNHQDLVSTNSQNESVEQKSTLAPSSTKSHSFLPPWSRT